MQQVETVTRRAASRQLLPHAFEMVFTIEKTLRYYKRILR